MKGGKVVGIGIGCSLGCFRKHPRMIGLVLAEFGFRSRASVGDGMEWME